MSLNNRKFRFFMAAAAVLLMGAALRLHGISAMRDMLFYDEAYYAVNAISLIQQPRLTPFFPENTGRESLWMYLLAPAISIFGAVPFTLRYAAAMVGIVTLAALLRFGRTVLGQSGAIWATLALSVLYWHVHNSHVGFRALLFPLVGMLALDALLCAYQKNVRRDWIFAGFFAGLLAYTYTAAHGWIALILLICGVWALFDEKCRMGAIPVIAVGVLMGLPVWVAMQTNPLSDGGLNRTAISTWDEFIFNVQNWLQAWTGYSDINPNNNYPGYPILDTPLTILAGLGVLSVWFVVRKKGYSLLLLAVFIISLMPSLLTIRTPQYIRALGVVVPLAVVIGAGAVGIEQAVKFLTQRRRDTEKNELAGQPLHRDIPTPSPSPLHRDIPTPSPSPLHRDIPTPSPSPLHRGGNPTSPLHVWRGGWEVRSEKLWRVAKAALKAVSKEAKSQKPRAKNSALSTQHLTLFIFRCLLLFFLLWAGANTWRTFDRWLAEYRLVLWVDDRINAAMAFIEVNTPPEMPIYIAELDYHPVAEFHAYHLQREVHYFDFSDAAENTCFVTPREPAVYLDLPIIVNQQARRMADYGTVDILFQHPDNEYHILRFIPHEDVMLDWDHAALMGDSLSVRAVQPITNSVQPGDTLTIYLGMRLQQPLSQQYNWFVHLQGIPTPYDGGIQYSAGDTPLCSAAMDARRTPDETLIQKVQLAIPADLTPGNYHLGIGLYDPATGARLPIASPDGENRFFRVLDVRVLADE